MQISSLQSSSLFSELATSSTSSTSSSSASSQDSFDSALTSLMSAIKSGDTTDAKKYLTEVEKLSSSNTDSNTNSDSPLGEFLSSVSTALSDNNIAGAQSALTTLETYATPSTTSASSTTDTSSTSGSSSDSTGNVLTQDMLSLFSAINSGDLSSAQTAYDKVTSLLDSSNSPSSSTSNSSSSSSTSSSSSSTSASFTSLLKEIGSALGSGDVSTAQTALDNFLSSLSSGSLVSASA